MLGNTAPVGIDRHENFVGRNENIGRDVVLLGETFAGWNTGVLLLRVVVF